MKYILRESNDINRYIRYILEEDAKDEKPRGNGNLPDFKTADDVLKSYSKDNKGVTDRLAELGSMSSNMNDIIEKITGEINTAMIEDDTSVDETEKSNAIKASLRKLNTIFETNDIFNKYLKGDRLDKAGKLVKNVFDLAQKDTGNLTQDEINEARKLFKDLIDLNKDTSTEKKAKIFADIKDEDRQRLRDELNYLVKNHEEVEKRLSNAKEKYNDLSDDNKNEIKKYVETIAGSPKCEDITSKDLEKVVKLKVTCEVVIGRLVINDNNKESDENLSWEEKFKRLNTHDKEANDKFWIDFINYTFCDNNNINEATELRKALGESFEIQVRTYGMTETQNVFIRFVKYLRSKNTKIEHDGYSAIHNAFADRRLSVNDLLGTGMFHYNNIIFCPDFYNKSYLDCDKYLTCQYKIDQKDSVNNLLNDEDKALLKTMDEVLIKVMYKSESDRTLVSVSDANDRRIKLFGLDGEMSNKRSIDTKEVDNIIQNLLKISDNDKIKLATDLCKVYYNSFDDESVNKVSGQMKEIAPNIDLGSLSTTKKEQKELFTKFSKVLSTKKMDTDDLVKLLSALKSSKDKK